MRQLKLRKATKAHPVARRIAIPVVIEKMEKGRKVKDSRNYLYKIDYSIICPARGNAPFVLSHTHTVEARNEKFARAIFFEDWNDLGEAQQAYFDVKTYISQ